MRHGNAIVYVSDDYMHRECVERDGLAPSFDLCRQGIKADGGLSKLVDKEATSRGLYDVYRYVASRSDKLRICAALTRWTLKTRIRGDHVAQF